MENEVELLEMIKNQVNDLGLNLETQVVKLLETMSSSFTSQVTDVESQLDSFEQRLAMLTAGYAELATMITALVARVGAGSEEEIQAFNEEVRKGRKDMMDLLRSQSQQPFKPFQEGPRTGKLFSSNLILHTTYGSRKLTAQSLQMDLQL